jgi:hypothetical protein
VSFQRDLAPSTALSFVPVIPSLIELKEGNISLSESNEGINDKIQFLIDVIRLSAISLIASHVSRNFSFTG